MKKLFLTALILYPTLSCALELNYRLLDRPHIQSFINAQLSSIENRFSNFLVDVIGHESGPELLTFIKTYNELSGLTTSFRKYCIYALLDAEIPTVEQNDACKQIGKELLFNIRGLENTLLNPLLANPVKSLTVEKNLISSSNSYIYMQFAVNNTVAALEPSISSINLINKSRSKNTDQFSLEIGNQLRILHKIIRQSMVSLAPANLRLELDNFWMNFINVLQERSSNKEKRDYFTVNVFDLNIKVNEFFYSCERNKKILSKESYKLCDDIHKDWNNVLRQTLKF